MNYEVKGNGGNAILFLHGWGGSTKSFEGVASELKNNHLCINLDFSGFGKSEIPKLPQNIYEYANDVVALLFELNIKKVSIVAHSFGGRVAAVIAAIYPNLVDKLLLVDVAGIKPKRGIRYFLSVRCFKLLKYLAKKKIINQQRLSRFGSSDFLSLLPTMKKTFVLVVNEDLAPFYAAIKAETLIVWGKNDKETPLFMAKKINYLVKESALIVFDNAGHFSYLDNYYQFCSIAKIFMR